MGLLKFSSEPADELIVSQSLCPGSSNTTMPFCWGIFLHFVYWPFTCKAIIKNRKSYHFFWVNQQKSSLKFSSWTRMISMWINVIGAFWRATKGEFCEIVWIALRTKLSPFLALEFFPFFHRHYLSFCGLPCRHCEDAGVCSVGDLVLPDADDDRSGYDVHLRPHRRHRNHWRVPAAALQTQTQGAARNLCRNVPHGASVSFTSKSKQSNVFFKMQKISSD